MSTIDVAPTESLQELPGAPALSTLRRSRFKPVSARRRAVSSHKRRVAGINPTFPISDCGCPKNPPSFTTVMVGASTNAVNYPIGLTKPSLGAVN